MAEDRSPVLLINTGVFGIIAVATVSLRVVFRLIRRRFDASDILLCLALISSFVQDALNIVAYTRLGYGRHRYELPKELAESLLPFKLFYLNQIFFKVTTGFAKLSVCLVYHYLFSTIETSLIHYTRLFNATVAFLIATAYGSAFFVSIFQCIPIDKAWQPKIEGTCIDIDAFRFCYALINIISSILVIGIPLPALLQMKDRRPEIRQLMGLILLGLTHTACTIARLVQLLKPHLSIGASGRPDPQWANTTANALAMVEMNIGITVASLVVMRPAFVYIYQFFTGRASSLVSKVYSEARSAKSGNSGPRGDTDAELGQDRAAAELRYARPREANKKDGRMGIMETTIGDTNYDDLGDAHDEAAMMAVDYPRKIYMRRRSENGAVVALSNIAWDHESGLSKPLAEPSIDGSGEANSLRSEILESTASSSITFAPVVRTSTPLASSSRRDWDTGDNGG